MSRLELYYEKELIAEVFLWIVYQNSYFNEDLKTTNLEKRRQRDVWRFSPTRSWPELRDSDWFIGGFLVDSWKRNSYDLIDSDFIHRIL